MRTRLDELKRQEVSRLRMLLKAKLDSTSVQSQSIHCILYTLPCSPLELQPHLNIPHTCTCTCKNLRHVLEASEALSRCFVLETLQSAGGGGHVTG